MKMSSLSVVSETNQKNPSPLFFFVPHFLIRPYFFLSPEQKMTRFEEHIARVGANDLSLTTLYLRSKNIGAVDAIALATVRCSPRRARCTKTCGV